MERLDSDVTVSRAGKNPEEINKEEDGCYRSPGLPPQPVAPLPHRPAAVRARTQDVVSDAASFRELMISDSLVHSLVTAGFERPSPVQKAAIPLGRIGTDLIVQAKSGTGKTVVFAVICLERIKPELSSTQALILAPTREIAIQSEEVIRTLASELPAPPVTSAVFVGGLPMLDDEKKLRRLCHVAVGTPGRVGALLQAERLVVNGLTLLVLDEVDSLLGDSFYEDVTWIYDQLPKRKQVLAFSATYTPELLADLEPLMRRPQRVMMCSETVSLLGVKQFYELVPAEVADTGSSQRSGLVDGVAEPRAAATSASATPAVFRRKVQQLLRLLGSASFHQAAVFCNHKPRAEWLAEQLSAAGYPAAYLSGDRAQSERMEAMMAVRGFKLRVVVSTDVMARGVDLDRVNLVINLDLPYDAATYMHRVGRTGRFGSRGVCVSFVTETELALLVSYVDEQAAAATATAVSAAAAAQANGGGTGEGRATGEPADQEVEVVNGRGGAAELLLPLPQVIPEDLYGYELENEWERQALQQLVQKERQARQQQFVKQQQQGQQQETTSAVAKERDAAAAPTPTARDEELPDSSASQALLDLPPLPEEIAAARKAEQAAQAAARKAEKALRKQQRKVEEGEATEWQSNQQQQGHEAEWRSYGDGEYGNSWYGYYGYGYGGSPSGDVVASASRPFPPYNYSGSAPGSMHAPAYNGYHYGPHGASYPYQDTSSAYSYQAGTGAYDTCGSTYGGLSAGQSQHDAAAAAWAQYYEQWGRAQVSSGAWGQGGWSSGWPQPVDSAIYPPSSRTPKAATAEAAGPVHAGRVLANTGREDTGPGYSTLAGDEGAEECFGRTSAPELQRQKQGEDDNREDSEEAGSGSAEEEDEAGSEFSFGALRGEVMPRSAATAAPDVLWCCGAAGRHGSASPGPAGGTKAPSGPKATMTCVPVAEAYAAGLRVEEEGEDGEDHEAEKMAGEDDDVELEDESWVFGDEDFSPDAAKVVDNLVVLVPPQQREQAQEQPSAESGADNAAASAPEAVAVAGSQQRGQQRRPQPAPVGAATARPHAGTAAGGPGDSAAPWRWPYYGASYDPYAAAYGSQGWSEYERQQWQQGYGYSGGDGGYGLAGWGCQEQPSSFSAAAATQGYGPSVHPSPPRQPPLPHHPYAPHPGHHYQHNNSYYYGHRCETVPSSRTPGWYGQASYRSYPQYNQQLQQWYEGDVHPPLRSSRCAECLNRVLRDFVQQQYKWQEAYAAWYEQYKQWYEEWLQDDAGVAAATARAGA
ncbi:hypothetical protein Vretimale_338 [Volvox reticuliferus]|uniref:Uncharacterized protein n=1 Tax=Volvox reticuliferus TaxID=1737510 RepID=A0A8J4C082_9CHLO|nr:hypothetical protein Vretifemale_2555 [Volvox reticuliferus]GIL94172.1 hypothetical protein Vretimale_338 [Volvox reticuliferus]